MSWFFRALLVTLSLAGCDFSASTEIVGEDTGIADDIGWLPADDSGSGGDSGEAEDTAGGDEPDPLDVDDDGDGVTENEGDCDDEDAAVCPGAHDGCNGSDDDCDGEVDEDAWSEDEFEPNDDDPTDLGSLDDDPGQAVEAVLHNDDDVDRFSFTFVDSGWGLFTLDVGLSSIPDGATFRLTVENTTNGEQYYSDYGSTSLSTSITDTIFHDESGTWEVRVESLGGADCAQHYLLSVSLS